MYVKNETRSWQSFSAGDQRLRLAPRGTDPAVGCDFAAVGEANEKDAQLQRMIAMGVVSIMDDERGMEQLKEDKAAKKEADAAKKPEVETVQDSRKAVSREVQCAATKKNGERCMGHVFVPEEEYDEAKPVFCPSHRNEKASDYERDEHGEWRKKAAVKA